MRRLRLDPLNVNVLVRSTVLSVSHTMSSLPLTQPDTRHELTRFYLSVA